jgi:thioredoxin reductase
VRSYGGHVVSGRAISAETVAGGFRVTQADGRVAAARRLLVTTGLTDKLPDIPGLRQMWGRDVLHCPYCHGWELRDRALGVLATGPKAVRQALLLRQWTATVTLFLHTAAGPSGAEREQLAARDVRLIRGPVQCLVIADGRLAGVQIADGPVVAQDALFVTPRFAANDSVLSALGAEIRRSPSAAWVATDSAGMTTVAGVWAAGNVADPTAPAIGAAARGARAAFAINADLVDEDVDQAVRDRHSRLDAEIFAAAGQSSARGT